MDDFIKNLGTPFMAHVLRRLYDDFLENIELWYEEIGVRAPPRTHSTMVALEEKPMGMTELAGKLRQSHQLVLTWVRQLARLGFVETDKDPGDGRRTVLSLTEQGRAELAKHRHADALIGRAYERLMREADASVFEALWRIEEACRTESLLERLRVETAAQVEPRI